MACQMSIFWAVCIKVERRKKETVVSTKNIKQRNIYKICH